MSLCLALLLAVIAINWWQGWEPFKHPLQMPWNVRLTRLSTIHSQRRRSTSCPGPIVGAREPPSPLLGGSHQLPGIGLQRRVREAVSTLLASDGPE
jgi:hypothetical protein